MTNKYCAYCNDYIGIKNYTNYRFCCDNCRKLFFKKYNHPLKYEYADACSKKRMRRYRRSKKTNEKTN
jgi:hypothetical protein